MKKKCVCHLLATFKAKAQIWRLPVDSELPEETLLFGTARHQLSRLAFY
jgi:hypothetical protein